MNLFSINHINLNISGSSKNKVLENIAKFAYELKIITNYQKLHQEFIKRENEVSTGFEDGFAIPHARYDGICQPTILYCRLNQPVDWQALDQKTVQHCFVILVPEKVQQIHLSLLKKIATGILNEEFRNQIKNCNQETAYQIVTKLLQQTDPKPNSKPQKYTKRIVAICSCPAGIAHTYMAKEKLIEACQTLNYLIKVETRGAIVENVLTAQDIAAADLVILAVDTKIDASIFNGKKLYQVSTTEVIANPQKVLKDAEIEAKIAHFLVMNDQINQTSSKPTKLSKQAKKLKKAEIKQLRSDFKTTRKKINVEIKQAKNQISKTLKAIKAKDPKAYNASQEFLKNTKQEYKNQSNKLKKQIKNLITEQKQAVKVAKSSRKNQTEIQKIITAFQAKIQLINLEIEKSEQKYLAQIKTNPHYSQMQQAKRNYDQMVLDNKAKITNSFKKYYETKQTFERTKNKVVVKAIFSSIGYIIPIIIVAGLFIAFGSLGTTVTVDPATGVQTWMTPPFPNSMKEIGSFILTLVPGFLAMYIAFAIGNKPALAPGFIGGVMIANSKIMAPLLLFDPNKVIAGVSVDEGIVNGGFLGGILVGFLAGYITLGISRINFPTKLRPIIGLLFSPLITFLIIFVLNAYVIGTPIIFITVLIYSGLFKLTALNNPGINILIAVLFAMMINVDFGGPINKTAFFLSATVAISSLQANQGNILASNYLPQNAVQAAISIGPLGVWVSTIIFPHKFSQQEKIAGNSALIMGLFGISEGALPFVFVRTRKTIGAALVGSLVTGIIIGLLSTYNNLKFVAGLGSPIGAWVGYAPNSGYGFLWFISVMIGVIVMGLVYGLSIEKNEIVTENYAKWKRERVMAFNALGYWGKWEILTYRNKLLFEKIKNNLVKLKHLKTWIIISK